MGREGGTVGGGAAPTCKAEGVLGERAASCSAVANVVGVPLARRRRVLQSVGGGGVGEGRHGVRGSGGKEEGLGGQAVGGGLEVPDEAERASEREREREPPLSGPDQD